MMREDDVRGTLFELPHDRASMQPLKLKKFKLEVTWPYIYDRFIRSWGMFSDHHQVLLYFSKKMYVRFSFGMHPSYTSTPSWFYGVGRGHIFENPMSHKDRSAIPPSPKLVPILS